MERELLVLCNFQNDYFGKDKPALIPLRTDSLKELVKYTTLATFTRSCVLFLEQHPEWFTFSDSKLSDICIVKPHIRKIGGKVFRRIRPKHCVVGTKGSKLITSMKSVLPKVEDTFYTGTNLYLDDYSVFGDIGNKRPTGFETYLKSYGITKLTFAGVVFEDFIKRSASQAIDKGYKVNILKNCVAGYSSIRINRAKEHLIKKGVKFI